MVNTHLAAAESREHFRAIVQSSDDAIVSKTLDGIIMSWNPGATVIFGYTAEEMIGQPMTRLMPDDRQFEEPLILKRIGLGEKVDHFETIRACKDGRLINVSVTISPLYDAAGNLIGASKVARDITDRKIVQQRMELMDSVFAHTSEAILVTDLNGVILEVNQAFTDITGYSREEVILRDPSLFRSGRQGPEVYLSMLHSLQETGHCHGEVWSRRKDGHAYAVLLTVSRVPDLSGESSKYVALFSDITILREQQEKMEQLAYFDPLTQLPNRLLLGDRLKQAMTQTTRLQQSLAVVYLDLDGFKAVNDQHGHDVGDDLLIALAAHMNAAVRAHDTLARIGGDEFVLILNDVGSFSQCSIVLDRILAACREPIFVKGAAVQISASLGVTLYPQDDSEADQLLRHADQAMYLSKQHGRNRYQIFDAQKDAETRQRSLQIARLSKALEENELVLYFQPKVNLRTKTVTGAEALVRWAHPELGLLLPGAFLPLIETQHMIEALGENVIQKALRQLALWNAAGLQTELSVNIAPEHLRSEGFSASLFEQLAQCPTVSPAQLELEIVESSAISNTTAVARTIGACRERGIRFSIDDFGTGYSSLTYLKKLQVDTIKIDQSFVRDMLDDPDDYAIVKGVVSLADAFGKHVIAEGVETQEQATALLALGCEHAQGFGIARPMPASDLPGWIGTWTDNRNIDVPFLKDGDSYGAAR